MGAINGQETRTGIWYTDKDGQEKKLEGVYRLKFYGQKARLASAPWAVFNPRHILVPKTSALHAEAGEEGLLLNFHDSETFSEQEALDEAQADAKRDEEAGAGNEKLQALFRQRNEAQEEIDRILRPEHFEVKA